MLSSFQITPPLIPQLNLLQVQNPTPRPILFSFDTCKFLGPFHYQSQLRNWGGGGGPSFCWQAYGKWRHSSGNSEFSSELISLIIRGGESLLFDRDYTLAYSESQSDLSSKPLCIRHSSARPFEIYYLIWSSQNIWWEVGWGCGGSVFGSTVKKAKVANTDGDLNVSLQDLKKIIHKWFFLT